MNNKEEEIITLFLKRLKSNKNRNIDISYKDMKEFVSFLINKDKE